MPAALIDPVIRLMRAADLPAYKQLRDGMLAAHPQAFTSDAATELKRDADSYRSRLSGGGDGASLFTLTAWITSPPPETYSGGPPRGPSHSWDGPANDLCSPRMVGAISCEHEARVKVRHIAHIVGMMVSNELHGQGIGRSLLERALNLLQGEPVLELVTLSVTSGNARAVRLYEACGFQRYGRLPGALKLPDGQMLDKDLMCRRLRPV